MKPQQETLRELRNEFITAAAVIGVILVGAFIVELLL
jgi:hypothetical protein